MTGFSAGLVPPMLLLALPMLLLALIVAAAVHDVIARTVPGLLCIAVAVLGLVLRVRSGELGSALLAAGIVCAGAAFCWSRGWLGGGDVKLLAACALAVPPHAVPGLVAGTAIAGAGLALLYLAARHWVRPPLGRRPAGLLARATRAERWRIARGGPLPYAVAIAIGAGNALLPAGPAERAHGAPPAARSAPAPTHQAAAPAIARISRGGVET